MTSRILQANSLLHFEINYNYFTTIQVFYPSFQEVITKLVVLLKIELFFFVLLNTFINQFLFLKYMLVHLLRSEKFFRSIFSKFGVNEQIALLVKEQKLKNINSIIGLMNFWNYFAYSFYCCKQNKKYKIVHEEVIRNLSFESLTDISETKLAMETFNAGNFSNLLKFLHSINIFRKEQSLFIKNQPVYTSKSGKIFSAIYIFAVLPLFAYIFGRNF